MPFALHRVVGSRTVLRTVDERTLRIGRGAGCELRLEDTAVALEHAQIHESERDGGGSAYHLTDLGSVTGTYVNGEPVTGARLRDGDEVGIGGYLLRVRHGEPDDPLFLHVRPADADPRPDAGTAAKAAVDYGRRYRLRRRFWTKGALALVVAVIGVAAIAALPATRRTDAFRPGDLTSVHADRIDAAACSECHTPWRGVADASCQACHGAGRIDAAPAHHPEAVAPASLGCTGCHLEHRGRDALLPGGDASCRDCHRELDLASGVEPLFAARVPSFAEHPELRLTLPAIDGGGGESSARGSGFRRLPVTDPEARRSDPTRLAFGHARHLGRPLQRSAADGPEGGERFVTLSCESCHERQGRGFVAISFERHCADCHALTFDDRYPRRQAEHGPPEAVARDLGLFYQEAGRAGAAPRRGRDEIEGFLGAGGRSRQERVRGAREEALRAERFLYQSACSTCHAIDLSGGGLRPAVDDPAIPERWLPHARFSHGEHLDLRSGDRRLACVDCHTGAEASAETHDLLLPSIASCTPCHADEGGGTRTAAASAVPVIPGPSSCRTCHDYHSGNRFPGAAVAARASRASAGGAS